MLAEQDRWPAPVTVIELPVATLDATVRPPALYNVVEPNSVPVNPVHWAEPIRIGELTTAPSK